MLVLGNQEIKMTLIEKIQETKGKIFSVEFIKKNGEKRKMVCRTGVKKGTSGVGMKYDPIQKGLLPVFDMQKGAFRMINLQTITKLTIMGLVEDYVEVGVA